MLPLFVPADTDATTPLHALAADVATARPGQAVGVCARGIFHHNPVIFHHGYVGRIGTPALMLASGTGRVYPHTPDLYPQCPVHACLAKTSLLEGDVLKTGVHAAVGHWPQGAHVPEDGLCFFTAYLLRTATLVVWSHPLPSPHGCAVLLAEGSAHHHIRMRATLSSIARFLAALPDHGAPRYKDQPA